MVDGFKTLGKGCGGRKQQKCVGVEELHVVF